MCFSFWNLTISSFPARWVSALDGLPSIKFSFFTSFRMDLTNLGLDLRRFLLRSSSPRLSALPRIPKFFRNLFQLTSLLAFLVGLNLTFLKGARAWFFEMAKVAPFESVEVFSKDQFFSLYFSLFSSIISLFLCLLPSAALFMLTICPFGPTPFGPCCGRGHSRSSDSAESLLWVLVSSLNPSKCEISFLVDAHQANLHFLLFNSLIRFNLTPMFFRVTFDHALSFSCHMTSLKAKFFLRLKVLGCISAFLWDLSKEPHSLLHKAFFRPFSIMLHPDGFFF